MKKIFLSYGLVLALIFSSCNNDEVQELEVVEPGPDLKQTEMIVVCEGQFTKGTSAISSINYLGEVEWDVFRDVNDKPLGDVAQSMTYIDGKYFVVLNNSKQIKVIEPKTYKFLATIDYTQAASPRFMVAINDKEAVVSDLYAQLTIVNYKDYSVVKHIDLSGTGLNYIEKMTRVGDKLFCAAFGSASIWVFDVNNVSATSFRKIPINGMEKTAKMIEDKNGMLWVLGSSSAPQLTCIDPKLEKVVEEIKIPIVDRTNVKEYVPGCIISLGSFYYNRMDTDRTKGKLYFLLKNLVTKEETAAKDVKINTVYTYDVDSKELKPYTQLPSLGMMYGMNVSPEGEVYLCDCLDYTAQRGYVRKYKDNELVDSKKVGIYPRMIHFTEYDK